MENQPKEIPAPARPTNRIVTLVREKWPEYIIEILVIILSLTISFALDEWRETQRKREVEQTYLKGLVDDIASDISQLGEVIEETGLVIRKTQALAQPDNPAYRLPANRGTFFDDVRFIMKRPRFVAEDVTFADLKSTGNMQLLTSVGLKRALFSYYKEYEATVQVENAELDAVTSIVGPYLINQMPLAGGTAAPGDAIEFTEQTAFRNMVFVRYSNRQELLTNYQELRKQAKEIQQFVQKQLSD